MSFTGTSRSRMSLSESPPKHWIPLESSPEVMNNLVSNLGVSRHIGITDIVSLDYEMLLKIPKPVLAVILVFPVTENYRKHFMKIEDAFGKQRKKPIPDIYFMVQSIKNAAGTIALIHAVANNMKYIDFGDESIIKEFVNESLSSNPGEKALLFEKCWSICSAHNKSAQLGRTEVPEAEDDSEFHFISFVNVNHRLCELDGLKSAPVIHGSTHEKSFLQDAANVCKDYMKRDPDNLNYAAFAFGAVNSN